MLERVTLDDMGSHESCLLSVEERSRMPPVVRERTVEYLEGSLPELARLTTLPDLQVQCNTLHCYVLHCTEPYCTAVQCSTVPCSVYLEMEGPGESQPPDSWSSDLQGERYKYNTGFMNPK